MPDSIDYRRINWRPAHNYKLAIADDERSKNRRVLPSFLLSENGCANDVPDRRVSR
jgi:hypothetical protein